MSWLRVAWDRLAALVAVVVGALALILGWVGVSGEAFLAKQLPFLISGGIGGLFLLGLGGLLWLSADLRDEWTELVRIEHLLERISEAGGDPAARPLPTTHADQAVELPTQGATTAGASRPRRGRPVDAAT